MSNQQHIIVLGAGPAGCISAIALGKSGYRVTVIGDFRTRAMFEGLGPRTLEAMKIAGCPCAIERVGPSVPRLAVWAGQREQVNFEYVIDRAVFDEGLRLDARASGADMIRGRVRGAVVTPGNCRVRYRDHDGVDCELAGDFLVEARGRAAPRNGFHARQGPRTTALVTMWQLPNSGDAFTSVAPFPKGWAWIAKPGDGRAVLQISLSGEKGDIPGKNRLGEYFDTQRRRIDEAEEWLRGARRSGPIVSRDSGMIIKGGLIDEGFLRVGDAAIAGDPLSGHGIYYAASAALALPAIVNTLLRADQDSSLAKRFYRERVEETLVHHSQAGRDHYRRETRWPDSPFWAARQSWPPPSPAGDRETAAVRMRPVIDGEYVEAREVLVTADYPRGVWCIDSVPLVPLLRFLRSTRPPDETVVADAASFSQKTRDQALRALQWLTYRGLWKTREPLGKGVAI